MRKIFCIGFQKTGTSTLQRVLARLGYTTCGTRYDLIGAIRERNFAPVFAVVDQYDVVCDNPWPIIFRQLDEAYPGAKFILTVRDEKTWIRSAVNHLGVGPDSMQKFVYGKSAPGGFEDIYLARYRRHNEEVRAYFANRPSDLLVADWAAGDGWPQVCGFLGHEVPSVPFPHSHRRRYGSMKSRFNFAAASAIRLGRRWTGG